MEKLPPLPALRAFEAVARLGSITKAAAELHVTHGAVSQQLQTLEDHLGLPLFTRQGRRLSLSEDGRIYALRLRMALGDIATATSEVLSQPRADEFSLAVVPSFASHWLVRRLPRFLAAHPQLRVQLRASLEAVDFSLERVDAAIRLGPGGWDGTSQIRLFEDDLVVVASARLNGGQLPRTPAEIIASPLLRSVESWSNWLAAAGLADASLNGPTYNDANLVIEAVRQGQGITLARRSIVHDLLRSGELVQLSPITVPYANPCWLVWPTRSEGTAKLASFSQWLKEEIAAYQAEITAMSGN